MLSHLESTLSIFFCILLIFIIIPATYWFKSSKDLRRCQNQSILRDWQFWVPCLIYAFVLGFRWNYSHDWWQYYNTFNYLQRGLLYRESTEPGYLAINYILGQFGFNYYSIFILEGFVFIFSIYFLLRRERLAILFSLPLMYMACRYDCLNISRQFFAQSIFWIAFALLLENRKIAFGLLACLAFSIHTSAILWILPFCLLLRFRLPKLKYAILIYILCVVIQGIVQKYFVSASSVITEYFISNKEYDSDAMMAERFQGHTISLYHTILYSSIHIGYILSLYFVIKHTKQLSKSNYFILFAGYVGICLEVLGGTHEILDRTMWYFSYLYYLSWGLALSFLFRNRNKVRVPLYIWILNIIGICRMFWSMYSTISDEVLSPLHFYLEYKIFN